MNDLVILGLSLGGAVILTGIFLFLLGERQAEKRTTELRMFQMENNRLMQLMEKESAKHQEENIYLLKALNLQAAPIFGRVDKPHDRL